MCAAGAEAESVRTAGAHDGNRRLPNSKSPSSLLLAFTGTADFCSEGWQPLVPLERHAHHRPLNRNRRKCHRAGYARRDVTSLASTAPKTGARATTHARSSKSRSPRVPAPTRHTCPMADHTFLVSALVFLVATVVAVPLFTRLRLGSVPAYLVA